MFVSHRAAQGAIVAAPSAVASVASPATDASVVAPRARFRRLSALGAAAIASALALSLAIAPTSYAADAPASGVGHAVSVAPLVRATQSSRLAAIDRDLLAYVNRARAAHKLAPLTEQRSLVGLAHGWSTHLAEGAPRATFAHNPNLQSLVHSSMPAARVFGENIASFTSEWFSAYAILKAYLASPGHRANILSPNFRYVGIVTHDGPDGMSYNTMNFAG